jgi:hypothetical protein
VSVAQAAGTDHGSGAASSTDAATPHGHGPWRRRWLPVLLGALTLAAGLSYVVLGESYQPLSFGGSYGGRFPGLPEGTGLRTVNDLGMAAGDLYIPPQRGNFTLAVSIQNTGGISVTIEAVTMQVPRPGIGSWPFVSAGTVRYVPGEGALPATGRPVAGLSLSPGEVIMVGIPLRQAYRGCYVAGTLTGANAFYVKERFLGFTRWVSISLGHQVLMHEPEPRGLGAICP